MNESTPIQLRSASGQDLEAINVVIRNAISGWDLPERVKRLSLHSYTYDQHDFSVMGMIVAADQQGDICGIAAWESAHAKGLPHGKSGLLLHGLYVDPKYQNQGIGTALLEAIITAAKEEKLDGVLVKAQVDAVGFFQANGGEKLLNHDPDRSYQHRFWIAIR